MRIPREQPESGAHVAFSIQLATILKSTLARRLYEKLLMQSLGSETLEISCGPFSKSVPEVAVLGWGVLQALAIASTELKSTRKH